MNYLSLLYKLYQLKKNTSKTREQIKNLQDKKLHELLIFAYNNSSYYHKSFEAAGITNENINKKVISDFPSIDKSILIKNFNEIITVNDLSQDILRKFDAEENIDNKIFKEKYHIVHSSGSTGKPIYFVYDNKAWNNMLLGVIRAALWNMSMYEILKFLLKSPRILYIAATDGRYGGAMAVSDGINNVHANQLFLDIKTPISEWIERINQFNPNMVVGYPSAIKILGEIVEQEKVKIDIFRVVSCGEPLSSGLRNYFKKVFSSNVINFYGASESLVLGIEDDYADGMYLFDDLNFIDVENGIMYLTCLYNFAQPLIRYKLSDKLTIKNANENNRYPFTKVENILGRNEDIMWFKNKYGDEEFLHPLAVEGICVEGLLDYQFCQIDTVSFEMLAEISNYKLKDSIQCKILKLMKQILCEKKLDNVQFYVRFVDKILPDSNTGKKRLIITN